MGLQTEAVEKKNKSIILCPFFFNSFKTPVLWSKEIRFGKQVLWICFLLSCENPFGIG